MDGGSISSATLFAAMLVYDCCPQAQKWANGSSALGNAVHALSRHLKDALRRCHHLCSGLGFLKIENNHTFALFQGREQHFNGR